MGRCRSITRCSHGGGRRGRLFHRCAALQRFDPVRHDFDLLRPDRADRWIRRRKGHERAVGKPIEGARRAGAHRRESTGDDRHRIAANRKRGRGADGSNGHERRHLLRARGSDGCRSAKRGSFSMGRSRGVHKRLVNLFGASSRQRETTPHGGDALTRRSKSLARPGFAATKSARTAATIKSRSASSARRSAGRLAPRNGCGDVRF